jgi:isocitrate dehydrogenase (NAD+)
MHCAQQHGGSDEGRVLNVNPSQSGASPIEATLIPGDGIGPEIFEAVQIVFEELRLPFAWDVQQAGPGWRQFRSSATHLPAETLQSIRRTKLALKGLLTTPIGGGF